MDPVSCIASLSSMSVTLLGKMELELGAFTVPLVTASISTELERGGSRRVSMFRMLKVIKEAKVFGEEEWRRFKRLHITRVRARGQ